MHVVATAGHVDHGKSTLVRALTGMEPDRWAEERRRGLTIDLGFAWTDIDGEAFAFVDVPGHERFVPNMLAGVGAAPAALVVVAADEGWMPQTSEHVAALDALGVRHAVLAVTRCDLADPADTMRDALDLLAATSLAGAESVAVSAPPDREPTGLGELRAALVRLAHGLPEPDVDAPVRLWVDRSFTMRGAGTVVTGTLTAGALHTGDSLLLVPSGREVHVRGLQSLGRQVDTVRALARVAVNLRGIGKDDVRRGDALATPGAWALTTAVDVQFTGPTPAGVAGEVMLHVGAAATPARVRALGAGAARVTFGAALPLRPGDRVLFRDPGRHEVVAGANVVDVDPPRLRRRGAAAERGREIAASPGGFDATAELRRRGFARAGSLPAARAALPTPLAGDWLVDRSRQADLREQLIDFVARHCEQLPLEPGPSVDAAVRVLGLPDRSLLAALVETAPDSALAVRDGRVVDTRREHALPPPVARAVAVVQERLAADPFAAPEAGDLADLSLGVRELAAAERAGLLLRIANGVVLRPDALHAAASTLAALPQPFSVSEARVALRTTRRVAVPLLEMLDRRGLTRRHADGARTVVESVESARK